MLDGACFSGCSGDDMQTRKTFILRRIIMVELILSVCCGVFLLSGSFLLRDPTFHPLQRVATALFGLAFLGGALWASRAVPRKIAVGDTIELWFYSASMLRLTPKSSFALGLMAVKRSGHRMFTVELASRELWINEKAFAGSPGEIALAFERLRRPGPEVDLDNGSQDQPA